MNHRCYSISGEFNEYSSWRDFSQSQLKKFEDFILRANKYLTLSIFGEKISRSADKKILLIEVFQLKACHFCGSALRISAMTPA